VAAHKAAEEAAALATQRQSQVVQLRRQLQATQMRVEAWEAQVGGMLCGLPLLAKQAEAPQRTGDLRIQRPGACGS
jgi:cell division protein FtsB